MRRPTEPLFLARATYRRRRLMDAAKLMPYAGTLLFLLPGLWGGAVGTVSGIVYVFVGWAVLIVVAAVIARRLSGSDDETTTVDEDGQ